MSIFSLFVLKAPCRGSSIMTWSELVTRSIREHEKHLRKKIRPFGDQIIELCELQHTHTHTHNNNNNGDDRTNTWLHRVKIDGWNEQNLFVNEHFSLFQKSLKWKSYSRNWVVQLYCTACCTKCHTTHFAVYLYFRVIFFCRLKIAIFSIWKF